MKKILVCLLAAILLLGFTGVVMASSGKAIIPTYISTYYSSLSFYTPGWLLSNVTDDPVTIKITFYKKDGMILKDTDNNPAAGVLGADNIVISTYLDNPTDCSMTFSLAGNNTCKVFIDSREAPSYGYGIIEWTQDSKATVALVAKEISTRYYREVDGGASIICALINNGMPF